jgi:hypothetical protein
MQVVHVKTTPLLLALLERVPEELPVPLDPPPEEPFEAPPEPDDDEEPLLADPPEDDEAPAEPSSPAKPPPPPSPPQPEGASMASKSPGARVRASFAGCMTFLPRASLREKR